MRQDSTAQRTRVLEHTLLIPSPTLLLLVLACTQALVQLCGAASCASCGWLWAFHFLLVQSIEDA